MFKDLSSTLYCTRLMKGGTNKSTQYTSGSRVLVLKSSNHEKQLELAGRLVASDVWIVSHGPVPLMDGDG